jgi:hypothetical protein
MEVSSQLHAAAALILVKEASVPIGHCVPVSLDMVVKRKVLFCVRDKAPFI